MKVVKALLNSRKAWIVAFGAVFTVVVHFVPELSPLKGDAIIAIDGLVAALAATIAYEDGNKSAG